MDEVILAKQKFNELCFKKKEAYQTAEEFLSSFFMKKHGNKSLSAKESIRFIRSVNAFAWEDSLCQIFLKILKNNLEESFYDEHKVFSASLVEELKRYQENEMIGYSEAERIF